MCASEFEITSITHIAIIASSLNSTNNNKNGIAREKEREREGNTCGVLEGSR